MPLLLIPFLPVLYFFSFKWQDQVQFTLMAIVAFYFWRRWLIRRRDKRATLLADFCMDERADPLEFERRCAAYLRSVGWKAKTTLTTGDQGVDVIAEKPGITIAIQCKLYSWPVGNDAVQQAFAGMAFIGANRAAVVSNADFTPAARALAKRTGVKLMHFNDLARIDAIFGVTSAETV